ncbi:riboflavin synthase [Methylocella sp.]|uniref:riboflavin synthase n=1 Tax=Methylocella sp. TaxID=1978226 RepID=UPI0035B014C0
MFTGIVTDVGRVLSVEERGALRRMRVACAYAPDTIALGASIACSGPCLTVVARGPEGEGAWFEVDVGAETLDKTSAGAWREGTRLNLERALKIGDELGGHIVTGHVDAVARIEKVEPFDGMSRFSIRVPREFARFVAPKGSVALDGTSLTVNDVDGEAFSVLLIPHTLEVTTWGERKEGDPLNFEVDLMARYAARLAQTPA